MGHGDTHSLTDMASNDSEPSEQPTLVRKSTARTTRQRAMLDGINTDLTDYDEKIDEIESQLEKKMVEREFNTIKTAAMQLHGQLDAIDCGRLDTVMVAGCDEEIALRKQRKTLLNLNGILMARVKKISELKYIDMQEAAWVKMICSDDAVDEAMLAIALVNLNKEDAKACAKAIVSLKNNSQSPPES